MNRHPTEASLDPKRMRKVISREVHRLFGFETASWQGLERLALTPVASVLAISLCMLWAAPPKALWAGSNDMPMVEYGRLLSLDLTFGQGLNDRDETRPREIEVEPLLRFAATIAPGRELSAFFEADFLSQITSERGEEREVRNVARINQAYIRYDGDVDLRVGRFLYRDEREWLFDENLDGVLLGFDLGDVSVDALAGRVGLLRREPFNRDSRGDPINHLAFLAEIEPIEDNHLAAFAVFSDDRRPDEGRLLSFGLRSYGDIGPGYDYWADLGLTRGKIGDRRQKGYGFDLGGTYQNDGHFLKPRLTLGYAWGSGDSDPASTTDASYRQTGLQSNEASFGGLEKFKYYGEALDPDLSNIAIGTAGIGITPLEEISFDLVYHRYRQVETTNGASRHYGDGLDLVVGYRPQGNIEINAAIGWFNPGPNPDALRSGLVGRLEFEYFF